MTFDPYADACLVQTVHKQRFMGRSSYGDPQYEAPTSHAAYVEGMRKAVRNVQGDMIQTSFFVLMNDEVCPQDRLYMPGVDPTDCDKARRPITIDAMPDENGAISHYEVVV